MRQSSWRIHVLGFWAGVAIIIHSNVPHWSVAIGGALLGAGWMFMRGYPQKNSRSATAVRS